MSADNRSKHARAAARHKGSPKRMSQIVTEIHPEELPQQRKRVLAAYRVIARTYATDILLSWAQLVAMLGGDMTRALSKRSPKNPDKARQS